MQQRMGCWVVVWGFVWLSFAGTIRGWAQEEQALMKTLIMGLRHREGSIQDLRGRVIHAIFRNPAAVARLRHLWQNVPPGVSQSVNPKAITPPERSLFLVDFVVAEGRLRYEVVAFVGGPNPWGAVSGQSLGERKEASSRLWNHFARTVHVHNGQQALKYTSANGYGVLSPQKAFLPPVRWPPLCRLLLLGSLAHTWGEWMEQIQKPPQATTGSPRSDSVFEVFGLGVVFRFTQPTRYFHREVRYIGTAMWQGVECHRLRGIVETDTHKTEREIWVSPQKGYAVVKSLEQRQVKRTGEVEWFTLHEGYEFREVAKEVWLPHRVVVTRVYPYSKGEKGIEVEEITLPVLEANTGTHPEEFQFRFPLGTQVFDAATNEVTYLGGVTPEMLRQFEKRPFPLGVADRISSLAEHEPEK